MHHSDVLVLLNKNAGVQFGLMKSIHAAQLQLRLESNLARLGGMFPRDSAFSSLRHSWSVSRVSLHVLVSDHTRLQPINDLLAVCMRSVTFPGPGNLCREYIM